MRMLRGIKLAALETAQRVGGFALVGASDWRRRRLLILCYHGVSLLDEHECSDEHVSQVHLRRRFEILREEGCTVLPLGDAVGRLQHGQLPARAVALTFDDGLYDFKARAVPLLREFGYPATVYVSTYYCVNSLPVFDVAVDYLLWKRRGRTVCVDGLLAGGGMRQVPDDGAARNALAGEIRRRATERRYSAAEKNALLQTLCAELGLDWAAFFSSRIDQLMTPSEVASLDPRLIDVQLHTHRHRTPRDETLFAREIDDNISALVNMGIRREALRHFCYPSGDFDPVFLPWLRSRGVATATTCQALIASSASDPLCLPRAIDTMSVSETEFRAWISGAAAFLPRRRAAVASEPTTKAPTL